ncbi:cellulose biosynthesis cyclic di-GMP-binding regulatory protein BcsB [Paralcaligenes sp. KSB-10]|uniref:cellulose biosynthesis cyclic di-GMP-binding regulatory protein BcsB n=1 Tax=Paralcaligenes sp. KSB-10 TaxID=2901142 RepID=UPI001E65CF5E|nr:cellulose biosynthesis cyclic di-GMP-binding regulatory protein BcsB [Paralcaligenes sp. KSB-10]UHL64434.1 cellulose biosynthesis cyclic di-GMP-binding regulatory protein BcsB [Paralcaligenes sp. KSB-10]
MKSAISIKYWLVVSALICAQLLACGRMAIAAEISPGAFKNTITFEQLGKAQDLALQGIHTSEQIDFSLQRDRIATGAALNLIYTPSPSLVPSLSQVRVFLNDELMAVLPITQDQLGKQVKQRIPLDARRIINFNRVRLDFIGHYAMVCEDPANSALWLNISRESSIDLDQQALALKNDLSYFPEPFFDSGTRTTLELPFVFAGTPSTEEQRAAAILASYFGGKAGWRGARFPVEFNTLPRHHAIVFATNDKRPDFLRNYPKVQGPVVDMISQPDNPYAKLLLVLGRNDADLVQAATALALGSPLFRGNSVSINSVQVLEPRVPYDAPNWVHTDRPTPFSTLIDYPEQLQTSGLRPHPIELTLNLPPDLFIWRSPGIPMELKYHNTPPSTVDESRLNISVNSKFIASFPLAHASQRTIVDKLHIPLQSGQPYNADENVSMAALRPGMNNTIRFDFAYASTIASAQRDRCQTSLPPDIRAAIDDTSTLDFSGYRHYIALPNLQTFTNSGFPYSRMADLSETVIVMPAKAGPAQIGTMLDVMGNIGARTGYPGFGVTITSDWDTASKRDADLLVIGSMPADLRNRPDVNLILDAAHSQLSQARSHNTVPDLLATNTSSEPNTAATTRIGVASTAPIAAIVGMQSPFHEQRSIVGLLASTPEDYTLLRTALGDSGKRAAISGSVALVRDSGVYSQQVGPVYYVGSLPWWALIWYRLYTHPILMAAASGIAVFLIAFLLWCAMRRIVRRRLPEHNKP